MTGRPPVSEPWAWIEALQRFGVRPGLERIRALLAALGDPQDALEVALVAGTNGKGSVTALLDAMLRAEGAQGAVGRFVSPHLERFEERFAVDGRPLAGDVMAEALRTARPAAERIGATFFEVLVAVALLAFAHAGVRRAVLEVGMGGRFDATNATDPTLSVITQVALDHEAVLGPDVATIAGEKAGILRHGRPAVTSAEGDALAVVRARAREAGAPLVVLDEVGFVGRSLGWAGVEAVGVGPTSLRSPLLGAHQARNLAVAALAATAWGVPWSAVVRGAASARWPGRLEPLAAHGARWLLDGAHNPAGATALAQALVDLRAAPSVAVVGATRDRVEGELLEVLATLAPRFVATRATGSPRSAAPEEVAARLGRAGVPSDRVRVAPDVAAALPAAAEWAEEGRAAADVEAPTLVVAGSLFLVGEARAWLRGREPEAFERWQ